MRRIKLKHAVVAAIFIAAQVAVFHDPILGRFLHRASHIVENTPRLIQEPVRVTRTANEDCTMPSTGLKYPATTGEIDIAGGGISWTSTASAVDGSDATAAVCDVIDYENTKYLACTNLGFSIPVGETITGVEVEVLHKADNTAHFNVLRGPWKLISSAAFIGTDQGSNEGCTNTPTRLTAGSSSNLWGATLTPTIINASDFGVGIAFNCNDVYSGSRIYVYSVRINVYYSGPPTEYGTVDGTLPGLTGSAKGKGIGTASITLPGLTGSAKGKGIGTASITLPGLTGKAHYRVN